jgi:Zn-dependent protease/CBS domain-containing protein
LKLGGFGVGRWFGFPIRIDASWFVVFALVTWTFAAWELPSELPGRPTPYYLTIGAVAALLLFLSVLLHELAHSVVARSRGIPVRGITLFIFGGVAEMTMEARTPGDEFALTIAGPLASLTLAGVFSLLGFAGGAIDLDSVAVLGGTLAWLNMVLAVFNMVPAFPLDGGRILRALIWRLTGNLGVATRVATFIGRAFGWVLILSGLMLFLASFRIAGLQGGQISGAWMMLLGWFLNSAATAAARYDRVRVRLGSVPVSAAMRSPGVAVPATMTVREMARGPMLSGDAGAYAVERQGRIVGSVTPSDLARVRPDRRGGTPLFEVMRLIGETGAVEAASSLAEVAAGMRSRREDRVWVTRDGEIVGLLTLQDVSRWIERTRELGIDPRDLAGEETGPEPGATPQPPEFQVG